MTFVAVPGTRIGDYVVVSEIGRGGMAVVYLAEHPNLGRKVALKLLADKLSDDERFRDRFMREARIAAGIEHPNIVPIHDAGEAEGLLFIAMRYVEGIDLGRLLEREESLPLARTQAIVSQIGAALDAAHSKGLVHRDVKPSNVLLAPGEASGGGDHVYLADFGLARPQIGSDLTQAGELYGTLDYMAPEQFDGRPLDARTDVYALACVAYQCLTGEAPFRKESSLAKAAAHLQQRPVPPSELNPDLTKQVDEAILRGLAKDKTRRYEHAGQFAAALVETLNRDRPKGADLAKPPRSEPATVIDQVGGFEKSLPLVALGKLPSYLTPFVGRSRELRDTERLLRSSRLLTVTGIPGIGKSRFAVEFVGARWSARAVYVDLASAHDEDGVVTAIAGALGIEKPRDVSQAIGENTDTNTLVLLDNCELARETFVPILHRLLGIPSVRILATSRDPIGLPGEANLPLPPLQTPDPETDAPEIVQSSEGGRVFLQIAQAARPSFRLGSSNARAIAEICDLLGGLPLAIELVAASVRGLSAEDIASRLRQPSETIASSSSGESDPRYGSLWMALEWRWDSLQPGERELLNRATVFEGSFSLGAAEAVCAGKALPSARVSGHLSTLVGRSLVLMEGANGSARYRLLSPVKQWLLERHTLSHDEQISIEGRHGAYFVELAALRNADLVRADQPSLVRRLQFDIANLAKALRSSVIEVVESPVDSHREEARATGGRLAFALGKWDMVEELLQPIAESGDPELMKLLGIALCKGHSSEPRGEPFRRGQEILEVVASPPVADPEAIVSLARSWRGIDDDRARELYRRALDVDPSDPYALGNYLELQLSINGDPRVIELMHRELALSVQRCDDEIDHGLNLPWAAFDLGKFAMLLNDFEACHRAYAFGIAMSTAPFMIETSLTSVALIGKRLTVYPICGYAEAILGLGLMARFPTALAARRRSRRLKKIEPALAPPVIIVVGGSARGSTPVVDENALGNELILGSGTLISGGTAQGVSAAAAAAAARSPAWRLVGYAPRHLPPNVSIDERYADLRRTDEVDFGPREPIAYWTDILMSDIDSGDVLVLGIGGGAVSAFEFQLALGLGAAVAIVEGSGGAAEALLDDPWWRDSDMLHRLDSDLAGLLDLTDS